MSDTPRNVDEWIRECAKCVCTEALLQQQKDGFTKEDMADTVDDYEFIIRAHLVKAGLISNAHPPRHSYTPSTMEGVEI